MSNLRWMHFITDESPSPEIMTVCNDPFSSVACCVDVFIVSQYHTTW